jgi:hypothetical protein
MVNDVMLFKGRLEMQLMDIAGNPVGPKQIINNTVVTAGRRWVLENIMSGGAASLQVLSHLAVGTSTTAPTTGDSSLGNETLRVAVGTFTTSNLTSNPPSFRAEILLATNQANTTLGEVGFFNSSSGGTMMGRATFGTVNKTTSNTFAISYTIQN